MSIMKKKRIYILKSLNITLIIFGRNHKKLIAMLTSGEETWLEGDRGKRMTSYRLLYLGNVSYIQHN